MKNKANYKVSNDELDLNKDWKIKRLETALLEIQNKFNEAQSIAQFGVCELDSVTLDPDWTDGLFKIVGYNPKYGQLKNDDLKKIIYPEDWDFFNKATQTVFKTGKDLEFDLRIIRADGSLRVLHVIAKPKKDENGKTVTVRSTCQDITYIKRIENDLRESETFYRTLFENTGTASIIVDEDTTILMANAQFEKLSGYSKEEIEGKMSWKALVPIEYQEITGKYDRNNIETSPKHYEAQLINKDGNKRIILINEAKIPGTKKSLASLIDLTERKKMEKELADSERKYRHIVEKATAGMFILDKNGMIKYLNEYMAQMLDYSKSEMLDRHIKSFADEEQDFFRPRKPSEIQMERYNYFKFLAKEGKIFWTDLTVSPIFNSKKEYTGLLGIVTDINMQKGLEEALFEREETFTDIIYDMIEIINNIAKDNKDFEIGEKDFFKNLDNN